jgi:hypothetical protein
MHHDSYNLVFFFHKIRFELGIYLFTDGIREIAGFKLFFFEISHFLPQFSRGLQLTIKMVQKQFSGGITRWIVLHRRLVPVRLPVFFHVDALFVAIQKSSLLSFLLIPVVASN